VAALKPLAMVVVTALETSMRKGVADAMAEAESVVKGNHLMDSVAKMLATVAGGIFFKTLEMTNSSTFEPIRRLICVPLSCRPADGQHAEHHLLEPTVTCMQKYEKSFPNDSRSKRSECGLAPAPL